MKKKIFTMILIFILAIVLFVNFSSVQAAELSDAITDGQGFLENGKSSTTAKVINYQNLYNVINYLYNIAMLIVIILAIIIGIVLGIRIVFGSIDERADSKHLIVPYLASVATAAFAFSLWKLLLQLIHNHI